MNTTRAKTISEVVSYLESEGHGIPAEKVRAAFDAPADKGFASYVEYKRVCDELAQMRASVETGQSCAKFVAWALQEGSWQGCDLGGDSIQDKAESLGLIVKVPYDPAKHAENDYAEPGSDWYVPTDTLASLAFPSTEGDRHG